MRSWLLFVFTLYTISGISSNKVLDKSDTTIIRKHLLNITKLNGFRNHENLYALNKTADYIYNDLKKYADTVYYQPYEVNGKVYKNVIAVFAANISETIVIGAHYDVCDEQEGADDNASGVVGILELARLLKGKTLNNRVELVAYTLEEPPHFSTKNMGSYIHAKSLVDQNRAVYGMISLEMIGYYDDAKHSQDYPVKLLSLYFGTRGNFITTVNKFHKGKFARKFSNKFKRKCSVRTKKFTGPKVLPGIDFSDHRNYWNFGYSALMITDTAFYRNHNYHEKSDTMETLDLGKMAGVIEGVLISLLNLK